ncbi:hypothetical protein GCM10009801_68340 [Streptomyces albiaxialis]|uniref:Uncharacterized protein n=1 Tax=Streptomyces albiaxialis TaxID=329523 RepID=A0ABN2WSY0_9ACTN
MEELPRQAHEADPQKPGHGPAVAVAELIGGPLDGLRLDVSEDSGAELAGGAILVTEISAAREVGADGVVYRPRGGDPRRWDWEGCA